MISVLVIVFINFNSDNFILGKVIEFSDKQESKGNVFSFIVLAALIVGFIVVFTFKNLLEEYLDQKRTKQELDRLIGKA